MEIAITNCWIPFKNQQSKFVKLFTEFPEVLECANDYLQEYDTPILKMEEGITSKITNTMNFGELYDTLSEEQAELRKRSFRYLKPRRIEIRNGRFGVVCDNVRAGDFPFPKELILFGPIPKNMEELSRANPEFEVIKYSYPIIAFIVE